MTRADLAMAQAVKPHGDTPGRPGPPHQRGRVALAGLPHRGPGARADQARLRARAGVEPVTQRALAVALGTSTRTVRRKRKARS
jgi:hypothetical protein